MTLPLFNEPAGWKPRIFVPASRVADVMAYRWSQALAIAAREGWDDQPRDGWVEPRGGGGDSQSHRGRGLEGEIVTDIPGPNPEVVRRVLLSTAMTCNAFRGSSHKNAAKGQTGEMARCLNCNDPQWKHWLRDAVISADHALADGVYWLR